MAADNGSDFTLTEVPVDDKVADAVDADAADEEELETDDVEAFISGVTRGGSILIKD